MTRALQMAGWGVALMVTALPARAASAALVTADRVNVRARPTLKREAVTQLKKGAKVVVIETVRVEAKASGGIGNWAKIQLPATASCWVFGDFVNAKTHQVTARRLNVRGGPGEEYLPLALLHRGDRITERGRQGDWIRIAPPPGAVGYVAARFLRGDEQRPPADAAPKPQPAPAPTKPKERVAPPAPAPAREPRTPPKAAVPRPRRTFVPAVSTRPPANPAPAAPSAATEVPAPVAPPAKPARPAYPTDPRPPVQPPPVAPWTPSPAAATNLAASAPTASRPRLAIREGVVRGTLSIQAPGPYELRRSDTGERVVYLYPAFPRLDLKPFHKQRVRVWGREYLDPRWPRCAVLLVERITLAP